MLSFLKCGFTRQIQKNCRFTYDSLSIQRILRHFSEEVTVTSEFTTESEPNGKDVYSKYWEMRSLWKEEVPLPKLLNRNYLRLLQGLDKELVREEWNKHLHKLHNHYTRRSFKDWSVHINKDEDKIYKFPFEYNNNHSLAYLQHGFLSSYAMLTRAFAEANIKMKKSFKPQSVLDFGSGPGTGICVANEFYGETLKDYTLVDTSIYMNKISDSLLSYIKGRINTWNSITELTKKDMKYDIVIASQVISELPTLLSKQAAMDILYNQLNESGLLLIVEPGTYYGSHTVISAREYLLKYAANITHTLPFIIAPCLHMKTCPFAKNLGNKRYCYFLQQACPPPDIEKKHRRSVASRLSYIAVTKLPIGLTPVTNMLRDDAHRILGHPLQRHNHVIIDSCSSDGKFGRTVYTRTKVKDKKKYQALRKADWGGVVYDNNPPSYS